MGEPIFEACPDENPIPTLAGPGATKFWPTSFMNNHASRPLWLRRLPTVLLFIALLLTLLPSLDLGFVSDDYGHLVEAARLPITSSTDGLHRPLRNILFRLAYAAFGLNPAPYHLAMIVLHLALSALLYRFVLLLNRGHNAALVTVALFGFFPRSHQSLFWLAAAQDTVVAICAIVACSSLLCFRRQGGPGNYLLALVSFAVALGFKETAIAIFPLLVLLELTVNEGTATSLLRDGWKIYLPFMIVALLFLLWVFSEKLFGWTGQAQSYYAFQSWSQSLKLAAKFVLNMLLPFSGPAEVRETFRNSFLATVVSLVSLAIAAATLALVEIRRSLFAVGWILIAMAPTAAFGLYTDRYLLLPFVGLALLLGFIAEAAIARFETRKFIAAGLVYGLVCFYLVAAVPSLLRYHRSWREAGSEVRATIDEVRRLYPNVPKGSALYFVNLTHSRDNGQVYVFNTSLKGALSAGGYDSSIVAERTFNSGNPDEQQLAGQLQTCSSANSNGTPGTYVFLFEKGVIDVTGDCGRELVQASRTKHPELWR